MKPSEVASILGIAASTIWAWSLGEYKYYLSPNAQGGTGRNRDLTELDARILGYIARLKQQSTPGDEIQINLKRLQEDDWRELPLLIDVSGVAGVSNMAVIPKQAHDMTLDTERRALLREVAQLQVRIEQLEAERKTERADRDDLLREIGNLQREIGELTSELHLWRAGRLKSDDE